MDAIAEQLDVKRREWQPELAEQVRQQVAELIARADQHTLDDSCHIQQDAQRQDWSDAVLAWTGMPDAPRFESIRDSLLPPDENPLG